MNKKATPLQLYILAVLLVSAHGVCRTGWREYESKCYFFSTDTKTWADANLFCQRQHSNLMSIQDIHERLWIRTQLGTEIFWIGLTDQITEGTWEWSDGSPFIEYLSYWRPGQPDNWQDNEDCGQVSGSNNGQWNDENCDAERRYICKYIEENPVPRCDLASGWRHFGSSCYKLKADGRKSWTEARHDCVVEGGDLVSILTQEEEQFVVGNLDPSYTDLWIGLSTLRCNKISCQVQDGATDFTWSDAQGVAFTNWDENEPTPNPQVGSCAAIIKDPTAQYGKWRSHLCRYERPYMCKRPLNTLCPDGWESFNGSCYWFVSNKNLLTTWHEAFTACSNMGAHLLIINSQEEQFFINGKLPDFHHVDVPDIWIGLADMYKDGDFQWVDKSNIDYSNFASGFPKNTDTFWDCGQIFTGNYQGKWETTNCFKSLGYVCEMTGGQNIKPTAAPDSHCDGGYLLYGEFCYQFEEDQVKNWQDAQAHCVTEEAHLVSIHSEAELAFITAHTTGYAWTGLNDINVEGQFVYTDGTTADFLPWGPNQPDNWEQNEDCVHVTGMTHHAPGKFNDDFCTSTQSFICKKAKGEGPPPQPPTSGPGWSEKCGSWMADPFNDFCYLFNFLSLRTWAEARADCVNQGGDLVSITDPFEQTFLHGVIQTSPTGISLWMGGHDSINEGGWEWTDGSPFRYIHWNTGNPDDHLGEDCLSILINSGYWNDDNCEFKRGYICEKRGRTPEPPPPHDGFMTAVVCQDSSAILHCPQESVINIQSAFYGRQNEEICPHLGSSTVPCTVEGVLPVIRELCDNHQFCFAYAHADPDPCPEVSKYLEITYSCEQKVCLHGLGVEDGNISNSQLSASSSLGANTPDKARLNGPSCWIPSGSPSSSWITVNLGATKKVTGIVIQGCPQDDYWVTKFKIQHSVDGNNWKDYTADGEFFPGATDRNSVETQLLGTPVSAQYIRINPLDYNGKAGLRFDVLGCTPGYTVTCADKPNFNFANDKMTVHCPAACSREGYNVFGTTVYRGDSNICAAAVHAGVIVDDIGGDCTLLKKEGQSFYPGSTRNGITSREYNGNYAVSYTFADGEVRCPGLDWYEFGDFCYKPSTEKKTWRDAQKTCRNMNAELVSILSITEQMWLESYMYLATSDVWTGLNDLEFSGFFTWSDNHLVSFTYWAPGEPNNHDGFSEDCVEMLHTTGRWNDVSCTELNTYICKMPKAHYPVPSVQPTVHGCPQGWNAYYYSCYWMEETARSWEDAKAFCKDQESSLVHVGDIFEQSHFTVMLTGKTGFWWTGLRARGGDTGGVDYIWDSGEPLTFTHWDRNQPDNGDGTCVAMTSGQIGGFWDDRQCSETFAFICEKGRPDISPPTKAPTPKPTQGCATGWGSQPQFRHCYKLFHNVDWSQKKSWQGAYADCISRGADLVSIHNQEEEEFLSTYSKATSKWIGLKNNPTEGGYSWSDGTPLSHTNWGHGEPNNHGGREDCVEMVSSTNGTFSWWNDLNCDAHQDWICKITKGKTPILPPLPPSPDPAPDCGSNPGWRKNKDICYYYNDTDIVDFHTAMVRCYAERATLVSIHDTEEQAYVNSLVGTGEVEASWIGMRVFGIADEQYVWVDLSPVTYTHWASGEPNNANGEEQCVQMNRNQGGWNDANCGRMGGYVCKKRPGEHHSPPPPTQPWEGNCPEGWLRFNNKCFMFKGKKNEIKVNWTYARSWCLEQGGQLAVIDNQFENDFVASYLRDLERPTWIGLSDKVDENEFAWSDGVSPVLYTNWNHNEPNNAGGTEHCVTITHNNLVTGKWNDDACHKERSFVCSRMKSSSIEPPPSNNPCPSGYTSWFLNCYKLVEEAATWDAAQKTCAEAGGNLASIDRSYDQAFVAGVVLQGKADVWIGLRRTDDNSYTWIDGWPVFFTQWGPGEPTNTAGEGCVSMQAGLVFHEISFYHGTWNDTKCDEAKPYICKISKESPPPTPAPGSGYCRQGFVPYGQRCYYVYKGQKGFSWPEARYHCQERKTDLASFHSRADVEFIRTFNETKEHHLWIGLTRDQNFGWAWTDKTSVGFLNWAHDEPNNAFHPGEAVDENCVEMYPDGHWNDNNCLLKKGYVCSHHQFHSTDDDGNPINPTPSSDAGLIAGAIIGAIIFVCLIGGLLYYTINVRGYKFSDFSLPTTIRSTQKIDVPTFANPNFAGESDT